MPEQKVIGRMKIISLRVATSLAARGESLAAFDERYIPASGVAPPSNTPGILSRRALPAGRLARLGATPDFHHGLLARDLDGGFGRHLKHPNGGAVVRWILNLRNKRIVAVRLIAAWADHDSDVFLSVCGLTNRC